jgi:hypothetical protein
MPFYLRRMEVSYECYFGRSLLSGSRFEQERAQLHRSGERDAYDAASVVSATGRRGRHI